MDYRRFPRSRHLGTLQEAITRLKAKADEMVFRTDHIERGCPGSLLLQDMRSGHHTLGSELVEGFVNWSERLDVFFFLQNASLKCVLRGAFQATNFLKAIRFYCSMRLSAFHALLVGSVYTS